MTLAVTIDGRPGRLHPNPMVIGQAPVADWHLSLFAGPQRHAQLEVRSDMSLWIRSLSPLPGTYTRVNGDVVVDALRLRAGDRVELGPFPPWCRPGAVTPFSIEVGVDGLDGHHRVAPERLTSALVPLPRYDTSPDPSTQAVPFRPGSLVLTDGEVTHLAQHTQVDGDLLLRGTRIGAMLSAPTLTEVAGDLRVRRCPGVRRIEFPSLQSIGGRLSFEHLPDLEELALPRLARATGVVVAHTEWLSSVELPALAEVQEDIALMENGLLTRISLPQMTRLRRVRLRLNHALSDDAIEALRMDFRARRVDGVIDAAHNGRDTFSEVVKRRLHAYGPPASPNTHGDFERFIRVAPELIEVHERMLQDVDRDGDRDATVHRLRRLLELAGAQADLREAEYDRAVQFLVDPPMSSDADVWGEWLDYARSSEPLVGDGARLWAAEVSAMWERPDERRHVPLIDRWRRRGARTLVAPKLAALGLHGIAARCATRTPDDELAYWLWASLLGLYAYRWRPSELGLLASAMTTLGRLLTAESLVEAGEAFVALAPRVTQGPMDLGDAVHPAARAAAWWLADDIERMDDATGSLSPERF